MEDRPDQHQTDSTRATCARVHIVTCPLRQNQLFGKTVGRSGAERAASGHLGLPLVGLIRDSSGSERKRVARLEGSTQMRRTTTESPPVSPSHQQNKCLCRCANSDMGSAPIFLCFMI